MSYLQPTRPLRGITEEVLSLQTYPRSGQEATSTAQHFHVAAALGRLLRVSQRHSRIEIATDSLSILKSLLQTVLLAPFSDNPFHAHHLRDAVRDIANVAAYCAQRLHGETARIVRLSFLAIASTGVTANITDPIWTYLAETGDHFALKQWAEHVIGDNGVAWSDTEYSRPSVVTRFANLCRGAGMISLADYAEKRHRHTPVYYRDSKEYSIQTPCAWFQAAQSAGIRLWPEATLRLLQTSKEADRYGGNRSNQEVESAAVASALEAGPAEYFRLRHSICPIDNKPWLSDSDSSLVDGTIAFLERAQITASAMQALWAACIGTLAWQRATERTAAIDLCIATNRFATRIGGMHLIADLRRLSPLPFDSAGGRDPHGFPRRWFDDPFQHDISEADSAWMASISALPLEQALESIDSAYTTRTVSDSTAFDALSKWITRLQHERPPTLHQLTDKALSFLSSRRYRYPWHMDGASAAFFSIARNLSNLQRNRLNEIVFNQIPFDSSIAVWVETAGENIDDLLRATATDKDLLLLGLDASLSMHEAWRTGGRRYRTDELSGTQLRALESKSWEDIAVTTLIPMLSDSRSATVEAATRGLIILLQLRPICSKLIADRWATFSATERQQMLFSFEALASLAPDSLIALSDALNTEYRSSSARHSLQAWVCLDILRDHSSPTDTTWPPDVPPGNQAPATVFGSLPEAIRVTPYENGLSAYSRGGSGLLLLLNALEQITGDSVADLESRIFSTPITTPQLPQHYRGPPGEINIQREPRDEIFDAQIITAARAGRWSAIDTVQLAQALLYADDPLLVASFPTLIDTSSVLMDDELEDAVQSSRDIQEKLAASLRTNLREGWVVLGGIIETFSSRRHCKLIETLRLQEGSTRPRNWGSSPNGRSFSYHYKSRVQSLPLDFQPLFLECGGLSSLSATITIAPSFLIDMAGFAPGKNNPPILTDKNGDEIKLEVLFATRNSEYTKPIPTIQRWVCRKSTRDTLVSKLGPLTIARRFKIADRQERDFE